MKYAGFKCWLCAALCIFLIGSQARPAVAEVMNAAVADEPPVSLTEARYEKLMKLYLNKIKLAFTETEDARSLEVLNQFLPEFTQKSDGLKREFQMIAKGMNAREVEALYRRISQRSHTEELVALLFDERITSRMNTNLEIKDVMDKLHAKSLEIQRSEREFIAAE